MKLAYVTGIHLKFYTATVRVYVGYVLEEQAMEEERAVGVLSGYRKDSVEW